MQRTVIIDGANLVYRTWWIAKQNNTDDRNLSGLHIYFTLNAINSYVKMFNPKKTIMVWDDKQEYEQNERELAYTEYKANREFNPKPHLNNDTIRQMVEWLGIKNFFPRQLEGDDCIAFLCTELEGNKIIVSGDGDFLQLISDSVSLYDPIRKRHTTPDNFADRSDFPIDKFLFVKCIQGDKSDNVQGVPKFGPKKIEKLLRGEIELNQEQLQIVERNMNIFKLDKYKEYEREVEYYKTQLDKPNPELDSHQFFDKCAELGINSILNKRSEWYSTYFASAKLSKLAFLK